ncbi:UNVERIFIED_CONTAM: hypothetical protein FKN15_034095 [Acipenser sinensis]
MESDIGTFAPLGLQFTGIGKAQAIMKQVMMLLQPINATGLSEHGEGTDIDFWMQGGVPVPVCVEWRCSRAVAQMLFELHAASLGTPSSQSGPLDQLSARRAYLLNWLPCNASPVTCPSCTHPCKNQRWGPACFNDTGSLINNLKQHQ